MPTTGVDFNYKIDVKSDRAFSGYYNDTKKNSIIKEATILHLDSLFATNDRTRIEDDLFALTHTNAAFTPVNNTVSLRTGITDYNHYLNGKVDMIEDMDMVIIGATGTLSSPIKIIFDKELNLRTGDQLIISGVLGKTGCNGVRYIEMLNKTQAYLFSDPRLMVAVQDFSPYINGGTIQRIQSNWLQKNDQKTARLATPSLYYPKYEIANGVLKILPLDIICQTAYIDYEAIPSAFIDVTNNLINYELQYSIRCLDDIANKVCELMGYDSRDTALAQSSQIQLIQQP